MRLGPSPPATPRPRSGSTSTTTAALDVWFAGSTPRAYRNDPAGGLQEIALPAMAAGGSVGAANGVFAADLDQDGDLDVFEPRTGANRLFRNNGDLTFAEMAADFGLAGPANGDTRDAAFGDLDNDRDLDIILADGAGGLRLLDNERAATFVERTERLSGAASEAAQAVAIGDVNGDGWLDIAAAGADRVRLLHGSASDPFTLAATVPLNGLVPRDLLFVDFDNDGRLDLAVAGTPPASGAASGSGLRLFRNDGEGRLAAADEFLPDLGGGVRAVRSFDYNEDGDADLLVLGRTGTRVSCATTAATRTTTSDSTSPGWARAAARTTASGSARASRSGPATSSRSTPSRTRPPSSASTDA